MNCELGCAGDLHREAICQRMEESGRVIVVTGGSKGIGRSVALRFAEEQAMLIIAHYDPDESAAEETLSMLSQKGLSAVSRKIDISSFQESDAFFKEILSTFGRVDVLVNNAGITRDTAGYQACRATYCR